jgi:hypothetical protein
MFNNFNGMKDISYWSYWMSMFYRGKFLNLLYLIIQL